MHHRNVEELVNERLNRTWGRPVHPVPSPGETSLMHQLIEQLETNPDEEWETIIERCRTHPHEAAHVDRRGGSCLHAVCAKNPPLSVIRAVFQACRRNGEIVLERDKSGRTPLMIAISLNADLEVIDMLLKSCQRAATVHDHLGHLPLHLASTRFPKNQNELVRLLLESYPEAAARESNEGRSPLQCAIDSRAPVGVIEQLVRACPEALVRDGNGLNPLFMAIRRKAPIEVIRCLVDANPQTTVSRDRGDGLPLRRAMENQSPIDVIECLCTSKLSVLDADRHVQNTVLHGALECGTAREATVRVLTRMAPEVALARSRSGETPLSLACQRYLRIRGHRRDQTTVDQIWNVVVLLLRPAYYGFYSDNPEDSPALHAALSLPVPYEITMRALDCFPEQASIRDKDGRFPLWSAIQSPLRGQQKREIVLRTLELFPDAARSLGPDGRTALSVAAEAGDVGVQVLRKLWNAHPEAGKQLDPVHHVFPFQVASLPRKAKDPKCEEEKDLNQLSAIFELLLAEPSLIRWDGEARRHVDI